ncbi:uncharacterized protein LOC128681591 [Plodia interpunctella]|uniref:uncharacterized protein LOC128681591 n=1 Tax=Plodia interpunctella TaxID=58824 RepID=UPI0023683A2D|nr:uncharacterized protein LOC128681591 [Plodia interpunctella]
MSLFFTVFLISQISVIYSELDEQNKYIDQLPNSDKEAFLERVARRIGGDVYVKPDPVGERKISDAELEKHTDYVKKIIDEEKGKFEQQRRRSFNFSHIDFTLDKKRRRKRDVDNDNTQIPVKTVYDSSKNDPTKSTPTAGVHDIQIKGLRLHSRRSPTSSDNLNENADNVVSSDKLNNKNESSISVTESSEDKKITMSTGLVNDTTNTLTNTTEAEEKSEKVSSNLNDTNVEKISLQNETKQADLEHDQKSSHEVKSKDNTQSNLEPNKKPEELTLNKNDVESKNENAEKSLRTETKQKEQDQKYNHEDKSQVNANLETKVAVAVHVDNKSEELTINNNETKKVELKQPDLEPAVKDRKSSLEDKSKDSASVNLAPKRTEFVQTNKTSEKFNLKSNDAKKAKNEIKANDEAKKKILRTDPLFEIAKAANKTKILAKENEEVKTLQIAQDVVKALRIGIDRDAMKNRNKNIRSKFGKKNVNVYGLYENTDENSYEQHDYNREQPYYVPVYNYFENNAYYNAYNKYGPNHRESNYKKFEHYDHSRDISGSSAEHYDRAFYKTPHVDHGKRQWKDHKVTARNNIFQVLPPVIQKPSNLPHYDYDYLFGKHDELEDYALREGKPVNEENDTLLKNRIKKIRLSIYKHKDNNESEKKFEEDNKKGWLADSVEYHMKNIAKAKAKAKKVSREDEIDYDYLGFRDLRLKFLDSKKILPTGKDDKAKNVDIINDLLKGTTDNELKGKIQEVYPLLKKLVKIVEFEEDEEVEACVRVMGDLIQTNNEGLEQYDWLESTVNVQSAIEKLSDLTASVIAGETIHPSDMELLKYITYLHTLSVAGKEEPANVRSVLPRSKKRKTNRKLKTNYNRVWLYRIPDPELGYDFDYKSLQKFIENLADHLYDLHNAIKHISMVTTLKSQHWFKNLKDLYLRKPNRKQLLELILHLGTTRLFNLIEDSSKMGIEKNFLKYIHENQMEVYRIEEAFVFVLKVLDAAMDNKLIENY